MDTTVVEVDGAVNQVVFSIFMLIVLALVIVQLLGMAKVFKKAGKPAWGVIVPFYNLFLLAKIAGRPDSWGIILCISCIIPYVGAIVASVILLILSLDIAKNFGKGAGFGVGLWIVPFIFYPILGFGDAGYSPVVQTT
jgi:hypothetical protein